MNILNRLNKIVEQQREKRTSPMKRLFMVFTLVAVCLAAVLVGPTPAQADHLGSRPNWGACGRSDSEYKMVYDFGEITLNCGIPYEYGWGFRHILTRHYYEFQGLARQGGLNWSDLVHWAIYYNVQDPEHVIINEDTGCRDRLLYLHDSNGRLVWQKRFKMIYNVIDGRVITVLPSRDICRR